MQSKLGLLGRWPVEGPRAREKKQMVVVRDGETLDLIHGGDNHVLVSFFVSNDFVHVGKMIIPVNKWSDPEIHKGDEVILCLKGTVSILFPPADEGQSITAERFEVFPGERFFIPEGMKHQYFNFSDDICELLFSVAPQL